MKTAINGKVRIKFFWNSAYSGSGMSPIQRLFKVGRLLVYKVVYSTKSPFSKEYFKSKVVDALKAYCDVRWEEVPHGKEFWYAAYSYRDGGYIGDLEEAYCLYQIGLKDVQKSKPDHKVCSIGFKPLEQKWYGWSHRARYGFGVGDVVKAGDCTNSSGWTEDYLKEHPEEAKSLPIGFEARNLTDAKRMAIAFAESVS